MLKKTIKYTDFDGNEQEEVFYFHLSRAELMEMESTYKGGLSVVLQRIVEEQDAQKVVALFKDILLKCVGIKSPDGKRFVKNDEIREDFLSSPAYDELFIQLATDETAAADFMTAIVPKDLEETVAKAQASAEAKTKSVQDKTAEAMGLKKSEGE